MVTIEVHGLGNGVRALSMARKIVENLKEIPGSEDFLESQVRIVAVDDQSFDTSGKERPFIRLFYSSFPVSQQQIDRALEILQSFCDVEVIDLYRFFTKTE